MDTISTFSGGLDRDTAKLLRKQDRYYSANNIDLTSDTETSTQAVSNVRGNQSLISIPDTSNVVKITADFSYGHLNYHVGFSINGTFDPGFSSTFTTYSQLYQDIADHINSYTGYIQYNIKAVPYSSYVLVYGLLNTSNITTTTSITMTANDIRFTIDNAFVPAQSTPKIIGSAYIRDYTVLITTTETSKVPTSTGGIGQIWTLVYDDVTLLPTLVLKYNNYLNLTSYYPIPPTGIETRYENSTTARIYWTDNFNKLRSFNIFAENGFATDPTQLNTQSPVQSSVPILQEISTGSLDVGVYQAFYRYNSAAATTSWSEPSELVSIAAPNVLEINATSKANAMDYVGDVQGTAANKSIKWTIPEVDSNYERIEIAIFKYDAYNGTPTITITHDEPVPTTGEFTFTYTGIEHLQVLTSSDFYNDTFSFTHCKSIAVKDNSLIAANVRNEKTDFDYDSRVYRFQSSSTDVDLLDSQAVSYTYPIATNTDYSDIPDTHDAINPDVKTYKYQYNSTTIGGTGPNISYTFGTRCVRADSNDSAFAAVETSPYVYTTPTSSVQTINLGITGYDYPVNGINDGIKYAYRSDIYKTYQRNETYRFGIVFFDTQYRALFAKWIGDIRMPDYKDTNPNPDSIAQTAGISDFRLSFKGASSTIGGISTAWAQLLYIQFTVAVPTSLQSQISGFRIVRVQRNKEDRTILGAGMIKPFVSNGSADLYIPDHHTNSATPTGGTADLNLNNDSRVANAGSPYNFTFDSPEFQLTGYDGFASGDQIRVSTLMNSSVANDILPSSSVTEPYRMYKHYNMIVGHDYYNAANQYNIEESTELGFGESFTHTQTNSSGWSVHNYTATTATTSAAIGSKTVAIGLSKPLYHYTYYNCTKASGRSLYALYYRPRTSQYGGNTYSARSLNEYIPAGPFQPISTTTTAISFTHDVFGGDIFLDAYDNQKLIKNWELTTRPKYSGAGVQKNSFTQVWVCESVHNFNLRHGIRITRDLGQNAGNAGESYGASATQTYDYNTVYSQENTSVTYIPKSVSFLALEEFDTRIWVSEQKENGETTDSWLSFLPAKYYDAETEQGPINAVVNFKDRIYFLQDSGYGIVPISERALLQTDPINATELQLGTTGEVIQRPEYISKNIGTRHAFSVLTTPTALYFFDVLNKKFYRQTDSIRPIEGLNSYYNSNIKGKVLSTDKATYLDATILRNGIVTGYDRDKENVHLTIFDGQYDSATATYSQFQQTIIFNEDKQLYTSFLSAQPHLYIDSGRDMLTEDPTNQSEIYIHKDGDYGTFYGTIYESSISFIVNENPTITKLFSNMEWQTEVLNTTVSPPINIVGETWTKMRVYDDYQNTDYFSFVTESNIKRRKRTWRTAIPRNALITTGTDFNMFDAANINTARLFREPIKDTYAVIELFYSNNNNYRIICPFATTKYIVSPR